MKLQQSFKSKLENDSTNYTDSSLPVIFKKYYPEHSQNTLFKEDSCSSNTDRRKEQQNETSNKHNNITIAEKSFIVSNRNDTIQNSQKAVRKQKDDMQELKRYIGRAENINKFEMENLKKQMQKEKKLLNYKPAQSKNNFINTPRIIKKQIQTALIEIPKMQKLKDIYLHKNQTNKKQSKTINTKQKALKNVDIKSKIVYDSLPSSSEQDSEPKQIQKKMELTKITEDSHQQEILRKNHQLRNSGIDGLKGIVIEAKSRISKYMERINNQDLTTLYEPNQTIPRIQINTPAIKQRYSRISPQQSVLPKKIDKNENSQKITQVSQIQPLRPKLNIPTSLTINKKSTSIMAKTQRASIQSFEKKFKQLELFSESKQKVQYHDISIQIQPEQTKEFFTQVPSVHQLVIGKMPNKIQNLKKQHNFSESLNEQNYHSMLKDYKPRTDLLKNVDISDFVVKKYKNGVYFGQLKNKQVIIEQSNPIKQGFGSIFYYTGRLYQGQFKNDLKQGKGLQLYPDGSYYQGEFQHGQKSGKGRFVWSNGQIYDGQWQRGKKHGSGMWKSTNQQPYECYIGQWHGNKVEGFGVHTTSAGDRYEGQFKNSLKQGLGTERFQNGDVYVGAYDKGRQNGYGQYYFKNGDIYKGQFSNSLMHGNGLFKSKKGDIYEGEYKNGKKCGHGQFCYKSGEIYIGNFENNLRHGYGEVLNGNQVAYKGYWVNDKMLGENIPSQKLQQTFNRTAYGSLMNTANTKDMTTTISLEKKQYHRLKAGKNKKINSPQKSKIPKLSKSPKIKHNNIKSKSPEYKRQCSCNREH